MPTLRELQDFATRSKNDDAVRVINTYFEFSEEDWCKHHFYLGGQLRMKITDEITQSHIQKVESINEKALSAANSWEHASMHKHASELCTIKALLSSYGHLQ